MLVVGFAILVGLLSPGRLNLSVSALRSKLAVTDSDGTAPLHGAPSDSTDASEQAPSNSAPSDEPIAYIDAEDPKQSSWCRYLNHGEWGSPSINTRSVKAKDPLLRRRS